jgi:hypothetical protein
MSARDLSTAAGGVLILVIPYLVIALALGGRTIWSQGLGVGVAALMTWLTSFAVTEAVMDLQHADPVRAASIPFLLLTVTGLATVGFGMRDLGRAVHAAGFWTRTPAAARLAFLAVCYWLAVFAADTYLTASPPLERMLLAPGLALAHLGAALLLRAPGAGARSAGLLVAAGTGLATAAYWVAFAPYLTLSGGPPAVPDLTYFTRLPWPVLLSLSMALDLAVAATEGRRLLARLRPLTS